LKQLRTRNIIVFLILFSVNGFLAQEFVLKLASKDQNELLVLKKIDYVKKHTKSSTLYSEIDKISDYLKNIGYFANTVTEIEKAGTVYIAHFSLNAKIETALIELDSNSKTYVNEFQIKNNTVTIPLKKLQNTLYKISKNLDKEGKSFSKVQLKKIKIKNDTLYAILKINQSKKRVIDKVIIKGYENFPRSYVKNYFNLSDSTTFNQGKIEEISEVSKGIRFITVIKPPETLFTRDSTFLYLYFKKKQSHRFDGIASFTTKEDGKILFNGNMDLKLKNLLDKGEEFELFWNRIENERQELKLSLKTPYVFNSKLSPEISFSIYKQDSTFTNTTFNSKIAYSINSKSHFGISYNEESSENLTKNSIENIETFSNFFFGFQFKYSSPKNDYFDNDKFFIEINPSVGKRNVDQKQSKQFKIEATTSYLWELNYRNSIYIRNKTFYLNSNSFLNNELSRIGGANSIRGFNEQSIFSKKFSYLNLEYRFLTSEKSYLYTITDIANTSTPVGNENLLGIGLGYLFTTKNAQINLSSALGRSSSKGFDFDQTKLSVNWISFF